MSDIAIRVGHLSKLYHIGRLQRRHDTLREALAGSFKRADAQGTDDLLWALRDISFDVRRGEVIGIIGRNGAGKSTLLKILSRITEPTEGRAEIHGRVGSLLEVGTGFHPELTGRENIFLNGAILGMHRAEITRKFDEIVAFAEIEKFLDTPVKRYSSGMYVRLAFAVAAHLEPEILLVDEVLAVGDAAFQKKCLGKMGDVAKEGRTVLFVSHNMGAIEHLCSSAVLLAQGRVLSAGSAADVVGEYEKSMLSQGTAGGYSVPDNVIYQAAVDDPQADFYIARIETVTESGEPKPVVHTWDTVTFRIHYVARREVRAGSMVLQISDQHGQPLLALSTQPDSTVPMHIRVGEHYGDCLIDELPLAGGTYVLGSGLAIPNKEWLCWSSDLALLTVHPRDVYRSGLAPVAPRSLLATAHSWTIPGAGDEE